MSMYKLEISEQEIQTALRVHYSNQGTDYEDNNPDAKLYRQQDEKMIREFASKIRVFYDDDLMNIYDKTARDRFNHHFYRILVTSGKNWRIMTEIGLPMLNPDKDSNTMNLANVISALSFEVNNPEDYMDEPEDSKTFKQAKKRYDKNSHKLYDQFGELFYCTILNGAI
jgi:hypothetical protein